MSDHTLIVQRNGRVSYSGLFLHQGRPALWKDKADISAIDVDWSRYLGGATISADTWTTSDNVTIDSQSNTATVSTVTISGDPGDKSDLALTMTASDGRKRKLTVQVLGREG
jgi:hypothetical protein